MNSTKLQKVRDDIRTEEMFAESSGPSHWELLRLLRDLTDALLPEEDEL